ncbi:MAG: beta-N-acetylglucosaminidase domain-containing protein [Gammaproteobacteria bacterium]|nr:beta-N-acetylglucosaminidase domain-containing protein [Gammaproteobacteria bacterium]NND38736.1 hyaluronidase [Pseudomonadales bacterium]NNL10940.1 hyaluronidase [Pseudomonadales bacterium]NNM12200.1 hyaluronidase [Pseudomonadales bacterium]
MNTLGVVEAYYGRQWTHEERLQVIPALPALGLTVYVYAPKGDASLRREWRVPFTTQQLDSLGSLFSCCRASGVRAGLGFTPHGLGSLDDVSEREALLRKARQIAALHLDELYILFDDLPSTGNSMALEQLRIVELLVSHCGVDSVVVCPSYYSTDPVLEKVFGPRPKNYWQEWGSGLDASIGLCWTGEAVCSEHYSKHNLAFIAAAYRRTPVLWDNYPVNDSAKLCKYLRLQAFSGREPWLADYTAAHMANPMNQARLSLLPLATLARCYAAGSTSELPAAWGSAVESLPEALALQLAKDAGTFSDLGLDAIRPREKDQLLGLYSGFDNAEALEVMAWLNGEYAFDPECLTA